MCARYMNTISIIFFSKFCTHFDGLNSDILIIFYYLYLKISLISDFKINFEEANNTNDERPLLPKTPKSRRSSIKAETQGGSLSDRLRLKLTLSHVEERG